MQSSSMLLNMPEETGASNTYPVDENGLRYNPNEHTLVKKNLCDQTSPRNRHIV